MMYRLDSEGVRCPIDPGTVVPRNVCQPPVNAIELIKRLSRDELMDVVRTMTLWAPEAFERGLLRVSDYRQIGMYLE